MSKNGNDIVEGYEDGNNEKKEVPAPPITTAQSFSQDEPAQDTLYNSPSKSSIPPSNINFLPSSLVVVSEIVDPITQAIRDEILQKQREQLRQYLYTNNQELEEHTQDDEKFRQFLAKLTPQHKGFINDALK